jgi:hypothetical protein
MLAMRSKLTGGSFLWQGVHNGFHDRPARQAPNDEQAEERGGQAGRRRWASYKGVMSRGR